MKKGNLIAFDENKRQFTEFDFTGVLVNEKSYDNILCLACRKISEPF